MRNDNIVTWSSSNIRLSWFSVQNVIEKLKQNYFRNLIACSIIFAQLILESESKKLDYLTLYDGP